MPSLYGRHAKDFSARFLKCHGSIWGSVLSLLFWIEIKEKMFQDQNKCGNNWNGGEFHDEIKTRRRTQARQ